MKEDVLTSGILPFLLYPSYGYWRHKRQNIKNSLYNVSILEYEGPKSLLAAMVKRLSGKQHMVSTRKCRWKTTQCVLTMKYPNKKEHLLTWGILAIFAVSKLWILMTLTPKHLINQATNLPYAHIPENCISFYFCLGQLIWFNNCGVVQKVFLSMLNMVWNKDAYQRSVRKMRGNFALLFLCIFLWCV